MQPPQRNGKVIFGGPIRPIDRRAGLSEALFRGTAEAP